MGDVLAIAGDLHRDLIPVPANRFFDFFEGREVLGREASNLYAIQREATTTTTTTTTEIGFPEPRRP